MIKSGCVVQDPNVRETLSNERITRSQLLDKRVPVADQEFTSGQQCIRVTLDHETEVE